MKNKRVKLFFLVVGVLILIVVWLSTYGINETIDRTISVDVYEDDNWSSIASSIEISGNLKKTLFSTSFVGTFAIEYYEPSCRDGVQAKINWQNGYFVPFFKNAGYEVIAINPIQSGALKNINVCKVKNDYEKQRDARVRETGPKHSRVPGRSSNHASGKGSGGHMTQHNAPDGSGFHHVNFMVPRQAGIRNHMKMPSMIKNLTFLGFS